MHSTDQIFLTLILLCFSVAFLHLGLKTLLQNRAFKSQGVSATGEIVDWKLLKKVRREDHKPTYRYLITVEYTTETGRTQSTKKLSYYEPHNEVIGTKVEIDYLTNRPNVFRFGINFYSDPPPQTFQGDLELHNQPSMYRGSHIIAEKSKVAHTRKTIYRRSDQVTPVYIIMSLIGAGGLIWCIYYALQVFSVL